MIGCRVGAMVWNGVSLVQKEKEKERKAMKNETIRGKKEEVKKEGLAK
jgi:hypothetical protein